MAATKLHKRKLCVLLFLFVLLYLLAVWRASLFFCGDHSHSPGRASAPLSNWNRFLGTGRSSGASKQFIRSPRGSWEGDGMAEYHAWHYGPGLTKRLVTFFRSDGASSILDLGGGAGLHIQEFMRQGFFASCYDGHLESQTISGGLCATMDLTKPMKLAKHDWVLSLSVGRQIPSFLENDFITNIHNLNSKGVVIFWGDGRIPKTEKSLTNVKNNTEIIQIFEGLGYTSDPRATRKVQGKKPSDENYSVQVFRKSAETEESSGKIQAKLSSRELDVTAIHKYPEVGDGPDAMNIALTSCGRDKMEEALTLVKSAILFSQHTQLQAIIFVDEETIGEFKSKMQTLAQGFKTVNANLKYVILPTAFPPEMEGMSPWNKVFKPCSLQRLFLPSILPSIDALIYLDADSLVLGNLTDFWKHFSYMEPTAYIGVSNMTEPPALSWYQLENYPHPGVHGVNTGIALMNLTRMRKEKFVPQITKVRRHYEHIRPNKTGDQFFQNVFYSFSPEVVNTIPCEWNLRPTHCHCQEYKHKKLCGSCLSGLRNGVGILHGTRDAFSDVDRLPLFKNVYQVFKEFNLSQDPMTTLLEKLVIKFEESENKCFFNESSTFLKRMTNYVTGLQLY